MKVSSPPREKIIIWSRKELEIGIADFLLLGRVFFWSCRGRLRFDCDTWRAHACSRLVTGRVVWDTRCHDERERERETLDEREARLWDFFFSPALIIPDGRKIEKGESESRNASLRFATYLFSFPILREDSLLPEDKGKIKIDEVDSLFDFDRRLAREARRWIREPRNEKKQCSSVLYVQSE